MFSDGAANGGEKHAATHNCDIEAHLAQELVNMSTTVVDSGCTFCLENASGEKGFITREPTNMSINTGLTTNSPCEFMGTHEMFVLTSNHVVYKLTRTNVLFHRQFRKALMSTQQNWNDLKIRSEFDDRLRLVLDNGTHIPFYIVNGVYLLPRWYELEAAQKARDALAPSKMHLACAFHVARSLNVKDQSTDSLPFATRDVEQPFEPVAYLTAAITDTTHKENVEPLWTSTTPVPTRPFYLYIGSGKYPQRLPHALREVTRDHFMNTEANPSKRVAVPTVILIDHAIGGYNHDIRLRNVQDAIFLLVTSKYCVGALISIPCGPWTALRFLNNGPPVLFNAKYPDGIPGTDGKIPHAAKQALMLVSFVVRVVQKLLDRDADVIWESAAGHGDDVPWTMRDREMHSPMWNVSLIKTLLAKNKGKLDYVFGDRCMTGAATKKTTQFLCSRHVLPPAERLLGTLKCDHDQHIDTIVGKRADDKWASRGSEEFTPKLYYLLAQVLLEAAFSRGALPVDVEGGALLSHTKRGLYTTVFRDPDMPKVERGNLDPHDCGLHLSPDSLLVYLTDNEACLSISTHNVRRTAQLWHRRLGCTSPRSIIELPTVTEGAAELRHVSARDIKEVQHDCSTCPKAHMKAKPHKSSRTTQAPSRNRCSGVSSCSLFLSMIILTSSPYTSLAKRA